MITYKDVDKTVVTTSDGAMWACSVDSTGHLQFLYQMEAPKKVESKMPPLTVGSSKPTSKPTVEKPRFIDPMERFLEPPENLPPMTDNVFKERLSSIMTDNMFDRRIRGSKRGKLDMMRLWKAQAGAKNIFQKKSARKNKEYNVVLLVDESGSMMHRDGRLMRIEVASDIAVFLARSFEGLNLNLAIVGLNNLFMLHKGFDEEIKDYPLLKQTMLDNVYTSHAGYNNDFDALSLAYKLFKGRSGKNLLFMLSDGQPATSSLVWHVNKQTNPRKYLATRLKEKKSSYVYTDTMGKEQSLCIDLDREPNHTFDRDRKENILKVVNDYKDTVDSFGIGIQSENWQIPDNVSVENLEQLKPAILKELKRKIRRG